MDIVNEELHSIHHSGRSMIKAVVKSSLFSRMKSVIDIVNCFDLYSSLAPYNDSIATQRSTMSSVYNLAHGT